MAFFSKRKLRRVQTDRVKSASGQENGFGSTRPLTNILLGVLAVVIIIAVLGINHAEDVASLITIIFVTSMVVFIMGCYLFTLEAHLFSYLTRIFSFSLLSLSLFVFITLFQQFGWKLDYYHFLPITLLTMIITVGYSRELAIINVFFQAFLLWAINHPVFDVLMLHCPASIIASLGLVNIRNRSKIIRLGIASGIILFIMIIVKGIIDNKLPSDIFSVLFWSSETIENALRGLGNGVISGFILLGILPALEKIFGVVTNLSLLELADLNQPLLKRLALEAPGTYHHSLRVGDLAQAAAEAIDADAMLARVGAYYHDVGKLNKPEYFVENEAGTNSKHKDLSPTMSTLIITAHVKDGLEMAREGKLPKKIQAFVSQHHGTSVMKYFYREALEKVGSNGNDDEAAEKNGSDKETVDAESFRYPGPKPQFKEVGIVLLADGVEATSRTIRNITPGKLKSMVHDIVMARLAEGQLDQSDLTMRDFKKIEDTFIKVLAGIFHARIEYPKAQPGESS
ncbi:MAG: HDIG domain-containing protein [Planctomycetes bacterium]|nr:HDIG domain-containing protein [Planctomycetota bacterium]